MKTEDSVIPMYTSCQPGEYITGAGTCVKPHEIMPRLEYNLIFVALWLLVMLGGTSLGWWRTWHTCKRAERAHNDMHITAQTLVAEMRTQICTQHAEIEKMREEAKNVRIMSMIPKPTLVTSRITESRMDLLMADHRNSSLMQPTDPNLRALHDGTVYRWDARSQCWNLT